MEKFLNFTTKTISIIFGICICISIFGTVVNHDVALLLCENPSVPSLIFTYSLTFIGAIVITLGIISVFKLINKLSEKKLGVLAVILIAIYGGLSITNIILYPTTPNSDSYQVIAQALKMANGDTSVIDGSSPYFEDYSNNNAIVILLYYLFSAFKFLGNHNLLILSRVFNALFIVSAEILFYFGFIELTKKKSTAVKFLFLNAIFPSVPFISSWVYTVSICMPFMGGIFLCGAKLINSKTNKANVIYSIIIGILTVIGYKIRPVVAILSIAGFICLILWSIQDKKRFAKAFLSISLSAVVAIGTFFSISTMDSHYYT